MTEQGTKSTGYVMPREDPDQERRRELVATARGLALVVAWFLAWALFFWGVVGVLRAVAQDAPAESPDAPAESPGDGELFRLELNERAPRAGILIAEDDLVRWRLRIEELEHRLTADAASAAAVHLQELEIERARTHAATSTAELRDRLWESRVTELATELIEARRRAEPPWWSHPALWFAIGVAVTSAVVAAIAGAT